MMKKYLFTLLSIIAVFAVHVSAQDNSASPTIVIVVRHGEKQAIQGDPNPSLNEAGAQRAQKLAKTLEDAGISAIYTTQFKRATETGQPLAEKLKISVTPFEVNAANFNTYSSDVAKEVLAKNSGKTVLVIGHGNTVPQTIEALGGKLPPAIDENGEFDRLYVVIVPKSGAVQVVAGRY